MKHKNVVQLLGVCTQPLCMILEFCGEGDLYSWIHKVGAPYPSLFPSLYPCRVCVYIGDGRGEVLTMLSLSLS